MLTRLDCDSLNTNEVQFFNHSALNLEAELNSFSDPAYQLIKRPCLCVASD